MRILRNKHSHILLALSTMSAFACGDSSSSAPDAGIAPDAPNFDAMINDECTSAGDTQCDGNGLVQTCVEQGSSLAWNDPVACETDFICKASDCEAVSSVQKTQAEAITTYTTDLTGFHGHHNPIDFAALEASAITAVFLGDGSDYLFSKAIYSIFNGVPQGHGAIGFGPLNYDDCFDPAGVAPIVNGSWYGVCARAAGDSSIVTFAADGNPLGLNPGDKVIGAVKDGDTWATPGFLDRINKEPICDSGHPNAEARKDFSATHIFGLIDAGDSLEVERVDGTVESVTVPARGSLIGCRDPFRRAERLEFFATSQRPDGVVVIILPTLGNHADHPFPNPLTLASYRQWNADAISLINTDLEQYNNITGLVWDVRGNRGGAQEYGMGLMGSLGDTAGGLGNCYGRIAESDPVAFDESNSQYPFPYQVFVDTPLPSIAFVGNQAVVADGVAGSAADWLLHRADALDIPIFGHGGMGAYGYSVGPSYVFRDIDPVEGVHLGIASAIAGIKCVDSAGVPLEGKSPVTTVVDFLPADLAAGIDTQIEAAVVSVLN